MNRKLLIPIFVVMLFGCGADHKAEVQRHTDNITNYVYTQSYGNSLTYNEKYNLESKIRAEVDQAILSSQCAP